MRLHLENYEKQKTNMHSYVYYCCVAFVVPFFINFFLSSSWFHYFSFQWQITLRVIYLFTFFIYLFIYLFICLLKLNYTDEQNKNKN